MTSSTPLHHIIDGPADKPAVVLSNSLGTSLAMWDAQAGALATHFRVIRYDMRGHGRSPVPRGPYAIADLGRDLIALLDRLGVRRSHLCGLSLGGMVSMWVAANAPERVERLVVCGSSAHLEPAAAAAYAERAALVRERGTDAVADTVVSRWLTPSYASAHPDVVDRLREMVRRTPAEGYAASCEALATMDLLPHLARIHAPTLVLSGGRDVAVPPEHGERIAAGIAGATFELVDDAAHLVNIEQPETVLRRVLSHLLAPAERTRG